MSVFLKNPVSAREIREALQNKYSWVFDQKSKMVQYYMNYEFPDKQRNMFRWWQDIIEEVIQIKQQIYIPYSELEEIMTINNMKPTPLKAILAELNKQHLLLTEKPLSQHVEPKTWYQSVLQYAWPTKKNNQEEVFRGNDKVISATVVERKKIELKYFLEAEFQIEHSKLLRDLQDPICQKLSIDRESVWLLLQELHKDKVVFIDKTDSSSPVVVFSTDKTKLYSEDFVKIERVKCNLREKINKFQMQIDKVLTSIKNYREKAKDALTHNEKSNARSFAVKIKQQESFMEKIEVRKRAIEQSLQQLEENDMNKDIISLSRDAQKVLDEVSIDPSQMDEIMIKNQETKMSLEGVNQDLKTLVEDENVEDEVKDMLAELQEEVSHSKNPALNKKVEPKSVNVELKPSNVKNTVSGKKLNPLNLQI